MIACRRARFCPGNFPTRQCSSLLSGIRKTWAGITVYGKRDVSGRENSACPPSLALLPMCPKASCRPSHGSAVSTWLCGKLSKGLLRCPSVTLTDMHVIWSTTASWDDGHRVQILKPRLHECAEALKWKDPKADFREHCHALRL